MIAGESINIYIGNNNATCSIIRGDSDALIIARMAAAFWRDLQIMGIGVFLWRAGSRLNISDIPTRDPLRARTEYK